ncbi:MAG: hypothetical protein LBK92_00900 [Endomicrobium sp.]|jgi:hypothetical protein|nr:hypothetical protein [Endomicrobium sp.]
MSNTRDKLSNIGKIIKSNTKENDTMTVIGLNCVFYLFSERQSASKYIYQSVIGEVNPKIAAQYQNDICNSKPAIIIVVDHYLAIMNKNQYNYLKRSFSIITYHRNDKQRILPYLQGR